MELLKIPKLEIAIFTLKTLLNETVELLGNRGQSIKYTEVWKPKKSCEET